MEDNGDHVLRALDDDPDMRALRQRMNEDDKEMESIRALLDKDKQLQDRTLAFLSGELEAEEDMGTNDKLVSMRLPSPELERAEDLVERMAGHRDWRGMNVSRSTVLRLALIRGLDELQEQYKGAAGK